MSEIKFVTGKTVEAAMAAASAQYGNEKDVSYRIVEMPKKGFLGIGSSPAKIEVTYEMEDVASIFENVVSEIKSMKVSTARGSNGVSESKKEEAKKEPKVEEKKQESRDNKKEQIKKKKNLQIKK